MWEGIKNLWKNNVKSLREENTNGFDSRGDSIPGFIVEGWKSNFCGSWVRESRLFP